MMRVLKLLGRVYAGAVLLMGREFPIRPPISTHRGVVRLTPVHDSDQESRVGTLR